MSEKEKTFTTKKIYIRNFNFETKTIKHLALDTWKPETDLHLEISVGESRNDLHEVLLRLNLTAKHEEDIVFLTKLEHAGIFLIKNFEKDRFYRTLGSYCPNLIYPYACQLILSSVRRGGFPEIELMPVDFESMYNEHLQKLKFQPTEDESKIEKKISKTSQVVKFSSIFN